MILQTLLRSTPQLIILAALLYYLVRKRNTLSVLLFSSYLSSFVIGQLQFYHSVYGRSNLVSNARTLQLLGSLSLMVYMVFAIAFLMLIISILKSATPAYQFLDDSKQSDDEYPEHLP